MSPPTLSVTVTNYNYARFLDQCLGSIRAQTFDDFELILIDNASTDESLEVMRRHAAADPRIRIVGHAENEGLVASLREACELSRGRYRVHVDADDWVLTRGAFERQVGMLERHPSMAFVHSPLVMTDEQGHLLVESHPYSEDLVLPGHKALEALLTFHLSHTGMMMRLDAFRSIPGYPDGFGHIRDMILGIRLAEVGDVGYLDQQLYAFRQHGANIHLRPHLQVARRELLPAIDLAFEGPLGATLPDRAAVQRRVVREALVHLPTQYIFAGRHRTGWRLYWESCKLRPLSTVLQPRTISLVCRTVLGRRAYEQLAGRLLRRPRDGSRHLDGIPAGDFPTEAPSGERHDTWVASR